MSDGLYCVILFLLFQIDVDVWICYVYRSICHPGAPGTLVVDPLLIFVTRESESVSVMEFELPETQPFPVNLFLN